MLGDSKIMPTIAVKDLAVARQFYEGILGLRIREEPSQAPIVIYDSSDGLQLYETAMAGTNKATYVTWEVSDIVAAVDGLKERGVAFEHYPDIPQVRLDGDVHYWDDESAAWFQDPDGNMLCLHGRHVS